MGSKFGAKIVRGAYLEKERKLAKLGNYPDPVNDTYEATGEMYRKVVSFLMDKDNDVYVVVATHNEKAVQAIVAQLMHKQKLESRSKEMVFAQIYGMGEQITMPLGNKQST